MNMPVLATMPASMGRPIRRRAKPVVAQPNLIHPSPRPNPTPRSPWTEQPAVAERIAAKRHPRPSPAQDRGLSAVLIGQQALEGHPSAVVMGGQPHLSNV